MNSGSTQRLRILHVLDHSLPLHSGYAFRTAAILREQRRLGWDTIQVTGPKHEAKNPEDSVDGIVYLRTGHALRSVRQVPVVNQLDVVLALRAKLERVVSRFRPNLIHAHSPCLNGLAAMVVARRSALPFVYEMRASWEDAAVSHGTTTQGSIRYRASRALETRVLRSAAAVTTICDGLRNDILQRGIRPRSVFVIPNAVDLERFGAPAVPNQRPVGDHFRDHAAPILGFIGSFYAYEGLDLVIAAMPQLLDRYPAAHLVLVGGGPEETRLRELVSRLSLNRVVSFAGRVPQQEIPSYYCLMDLLVYPRRRNRLTELVTPLKPLEAMAQGKLVVASDVGGHRELIIDQCTGFLFPADDAGAIADCIIKVLNSGAHDRVREQARRYVETERTWPKVTQRYAEVYAQVLGGM